MLTFEIMGVLALGILWVNTLLVVGAALTPLGELWSRLRRTWRSGEVTEGADDDVLACHVVEQVGRKASDDAARQAILFHDRGYRSEVFGGSIELEDETLEIEPDAQAEVWIPAAERRERAESPPGDFDEAYRASRRAKGFQQQVRSPIRAGQPVWVAEGDVPVLSSFDPRSWLRGRMAMVVAFQLGMIAISALATWMALYPPVIEGTVSKLGGLLGLVHFLLVMQPLGVSVREASLLPHQAIVRGSWVKSGSEGAGVTGDLGQQAI
jgi:hypothetical protein